ncbi:hypothetical protein DFR86_03075 [Acidianus sulfidivorans JP7]|uniref:Uncharacterized protein n=1 Tax=Acidianus sulfidivorans JP7 TaxID=619593 RepID=A0A2U9IL34_9CREN|nr:hypothetical protein [Acidianus sulfidivorans]AWR96634.1 hypothetical protein DFR86_03075 [Acidianus sulfidivorans JP7]
MQTAKKYIASRPSKKLNILDIEIPCDTECLQNTEFKDLLNNDSFKAQLEIVDNLENLINIKINDLLEELRFRFSNYDVNYENLAYTVYRIVEYGGNVIIGEKLLFEGKIISSGEYSKIYEISKKIDETKKDNNVKSICDEIKYLSESLWEHFDKNLRRIIDES